MSECKNLVDEIEELRARLAEAEETINAIRTGQVDAVVVEGPEGHTVYTLTGAERIYRLLVEAMNEGALVLSPEGSIIYSNHTFAAMLGEPLEQVIGASIFEYVAEADQEAVQQLLAEAVWSPGKREISFRRENGGGTVPAHISVGGLNVEEAGDSVSAVVTDLTEHKAMECKLEQYREHLEELVEQRTLQLKEAVEDLKSEIETRKLAERALAAANRELENRISERKRAEQALAAANDELTAANHEMDVVNEELRSTNDELQIEIEERRRVEESLRQSEEQFRAMADAIPQLAWMADPDGYISWYNQRWYEYTGARPEEMEGWGWKALHDPEILPKVLDQWKQSIATGQPFEMDFPLRGADGRFRWFLTRVKPVTDVEGHVLRWFGTNTDITERVEYERANQELFEREHRIADTLQQALIPSQIPYAIGNWSLAARYRPALEEAQVGGDFYDVFELGDDRCGVLIGDIAGKGLAAAIRVAAVRHAFRSYAYVNPSPATVMTLTNEALCREGADEQDVLTAFFAVIDARQNTITYANAGHEPPVVKSKAGRVIELDVTGPMLGIIGESEYSEQSVRLEPGDDVVMFTDGITEARNGIMLFEKEGVIERLTNIGVATPDEIAQALLQAAADYAGGNLQDDAAIVVLQYGE